MRSIVDGPFGDTTRSTRVRDYKIFDIRILAGMFVISVGIFGCMIFMTELEIMINNSTLVTKEQSEKNNYAYIEKLKHGMVSLTEEYSLYGIMNTTSAQVSKKE